MASYNPGHSLRYMERQLRDNIGFHGTPLRLVWRGKPERERGTVRVREGGSSGGGKTSYKGAAGVSKDRK